MGAGKSALAANLKLHRRLNARSSGFRSGPLPIRMKARPIAVTQS